MATSTGVTLITLSVTLCIRTRSQPQYDTREILFNDTTMLTASVESFQSILRVPNSPMENRGRKKKLALLSTWTQRRTYYCNDYTFCSCSRYVKA